MTADQRQSNAPTWDLESIFPGGSASPQLAEFRTATKSKLDTLALSLERLPDLGDADTVPEWATFISNLQQAAEEIRLIAGFAGCLMSQNVDDLAAMNIARETDTLAAQWDKISTGLEARSAKQSDTLWQLLLATPQLQEIRFTLNEMRDNARLKMPVELESLALDLAVNGYHAWNYLYSKMAGDLRVDFERDGQVKSMSLGQLAAVMDDPDRSIRRQAFEKTNLAWQSHLELASMALNSQAGFRLSLYDRRGWQSVLFEPLRQNRLSRESLDAMWHAVAEARDRLKPYLDAKKRLLGIDKFRWYDEVALCGQSNRKIPFDEAGRFIVEQLSRYSDDLSAFCKTAIEKRWVEAEDRPGKRAGAFCATMGVTRQSRIFMTYGGSIDTLFTLAHELGHGYHGHVLKARPYFAAAVPMGLAETASIFSELATNDSALTAASADSEKLMFMDQRLQQAYTFFCNLRCRYLFDCAFYEERRKGLVSTKRLSELMLEAQRTAFGDLLDDSGFHPLFWCTKLHFFVTGRPFYHFPYTFGFLFATGVYDRAVQDGKSFANRYRALLADTGSMSAEEVARKHLGEDLTKETFWRAAIDRSLDRLDDFLGLAKTQKP